MNFKEMTEYSKKNPSDTLYFQMESRKGYLIQMINGSFSGYIDRDSDDYGNYIIHKISSREILAEDWQLISVDTSCRDCHTKDTEPHQDGCAYKRCYRCNKFSDLCKCRDNMKERRSHYFKHGEKALLENMKDVCNQYSKTRWRLLLDEIPEEGKRIVILSKNKDIFFAYLMVDIDILINIEVNNLLGNINVPIDKAKQDFTCWTYAPSEGLC